MRWLHEYLTSRPEQRKGAGSTAGRRQVQERSTPGGWRDVVSCLAAWRVAGLGTPGRRPAGYRRYSGTLTRRACAVSRAACMAGRYVPIMSKRQSPAVMPTPERWAQEQLTRAPARSGEWARRVARIYCLDISDGQEGAVRPEDREAIRRTGAQDSRASRAAAGLPEHIEDPAAAAQLARLMRDTPRLGAQQPAKPRTGTLGGSNRMLSARDVAAILAVPERTVRDKWREWGLQAYRIGKHLRWKERDVHAWIDRQTA
jgi:excisionase family DNA binding protein